MRIFFLNATAAGIEVARIFSRRHALAGYIGLTSERDNRDVAGYDDGVDFCLKAGVAHHRVRSYALADSSDRDLIASLRPDVLVVTGWQRLVPAAIIENCGAVLGVHGSPLGITEGRGRSPQNWALLSGWPSFELSIFRITPGIDSGAILSSRTFAYNLRDDIHTSYLKVAYLTGELLASLADEGLLQAPGHMQDEGAARYLPQRLPEDGQIDWGRSSREVVDFVRALGRPYPGAFTLIAGRLVTIWDAVAFESSGAFGDVAPGTLIHRYAGGELLVRCAGGAVIVRDHDSTTEVPAGRIFDTTDYAAQMGRIRDRHISKHPDLPLAERLFRHDAPASCSG